MVTKTPCLGPEPEGSARVDDGISSWDELETEKIRIKSAPKSGTSTNFLLGSGMISCSWARDWTGFGPGAERVKVVVWIVERMAGFWML